MNRLLSTVLALSALASLAVAQEDEKRDQRATGETSDSSAERKGVTVEGKVEPVVTGPRPGLDRYCSALVSSKPERLAPGAHGTVFVTVSLNPTHHAVIPSGGHLELEIPTELGSLSFGSWSVSEAQTGRIETAFRGQPVWETWLIIEVPVQVAADAEHRDQPVRFTLVADVSNGESGALLGQFQMPVVGRIPIGPAVPTPAVVARGGSVPAAAARAGAVPDGTDAVVVPDSSAPEAAPGVAPDAVYGEVPGAADAVGAVDVGGLPIETDEGFPILWIGAGAFAVLLFLLLAMARRGR